MAFMISTDAIEVYRGSENKIKDLRAVPMTNGRIYFATDTDKVFYDADNIRHEISGGGDVSFISATSAPTYEGDTGYYVFQRSDINASKLAIDNIILAPEIDNSIYRVLIIDDETGVVKTKQIAGGGGGGSGVTNPLTITTVENFPERIIDTQDATCIIKVNSIISTDETCSLIVKVNGQEVTNLSSLSTRLRQEKEITIPHALFTTTERNVVEFIAEVDENTKSKKMYFYAFHSEFSVPNFNPRQPYGVDVGTGIANTLSMNYRFSGLTDIKGHIHMYIDEEELFDLSDEASATVNRYGGGAITGDGQLNIPCTLDEFQFLEHGSHILTLRAYAVVDDSEYFVDSVSWDIIWTTPLGGNTPIIVSSYTNTEEENYNIINIPYVVYAKDTENIQVHLYVNGDELATSPITVQYDKGMQTWNTWAISKYIPNITNTFMMVANVEGKTATKEFLVDILPSSLMLDAESEGLLLYLSALDRSNKESALSRQTWKYTNSNGNTYAANFYNFNWNNDGWQLDDKGDNVLRLTNGDYIDIPFTAIMQEDKPDPGFTIEAEFRCRNATSFAKLMSYTSVAVQDTDEFGNLLWEMTPVLDNQGNPVKEQVLDSNGNPVQAIDTVGHLAYHYTLNDVEYTIYEHEDNEGNKTYYLEDNVLFVDEGTGDPIVPLASELVPIYKMQDKMTYALDTNGNRIPIMLDDGAVEKTINYVTNQDGTKSVANAVGTFFSNEVGMCIGTQEAFFASTGKKVNVRYADNDKVKVSIVVDSQTGLLYIYINAVLSGVERFGESDSFKAQGVTGLRFNSDYCDLDIYTIRIYNNPLNFDGIVQNWIGDAPNLTEKRQRYLENHITKIDNRNGYVTLDYELTKELSRRMAQNYKEQVALGNLDAQPGLPIAVISTYPSNLSNDTKSDLLPYNKAIKQYVDIRFWDPNGDVESFKVQDFELSVQGTSSQGYPRRNYKAKIKATGSDVNLYADKFPFFWTSWDGDDTKKDLWPTFDYPDELDSNATEEEQAAYEAAVEAATQEGWDNYALATGGTVENGSVKGGYKQMSKVDIGNGIAASKFCFKADYMDSSSTHNTSLADYVDVMCKRTSTYDLTHPMKRLLNTTKKYRQTVYGFPMLIFWDHKGQTRDPEFVGRYNFNTDKSATETFGFELKDKHPVLRDVDYLAPEKKANGKNKKDDYDNLFPSIVHGDPTIAEICECWELTSNQHGFTGFRRNDWDTLDDNGKLDFYNFWESRYHIMDFDPDDVYKGDSTPNKNVAISNLKLYAKNIMDLSKWIYSTDIHPWDTNDENSVNRHKLTQVHGANDIKHTIDEETGNLVLLADYYTYDVNDPTIVHKVDPTLFEYDDVPVLHVYANQMHDEEIPWSLLYEDEINRTLDTPAFYTTRDEEAMVTWDGDNPILGKTYYSAPDDEHPIPITWYHKVEILSYPKKLNDAGDAWIIDTSKQPQVVGYGTVINDGERDYAMSEIYEKYVKDTKEYRLSKFHAEFEEHLNFDYCAFYFILTEFMILYDSREKNMMIATWGPERAGGNYIWYPIFYDMDTQLGINNSGTVYWDYDVNAQDDGLFSGAGSVLWDNFYACFLERIKQFYRTMRDEGFLRLSDCIKYYNTESADRWTPIIKNVDAFYKYVAPSIRAEGLGYTTKQGETATTSSFFYCAQGDRTLNRAAFFRNRFNYKDSEWLGGAYRTQGGSNIEMRYDANWTGTSDPDASDWTGEKTAEIRTRLDSNATFDIKPYLTQYCSVYYDELPREGGRFDIQQEPVVDGNGVPDAATSYKYAKNIANIKKSGYITIDPLPAIKSTIEQGMALSQQLVYIYGPEYLRDLGDLSKKYLDRFFCQDAIRLNSLTIGNDDPLYKNTGIVTGAFELDTAYRTSTGELNPNAKALLEYLDVSNLSGLSGALDLSGCLKIKTVKALGTKYNTVTLPDGNVITSLYLPAVTNTFVLNKAQRLAEVIRDKTDAIAYYGHLQTGLYIENLTDRMNISNDTDIIGKYLANASEATKKTNIASNITGDPNYNNAAAPYYVSIKRMELNGGKLGFISYEILDYVVKQKIKMRYDDALANDTTYSKELLLRLLDVNWSPYEKLDSLAVDDRQSSDTEYFIRNDDLTYDELPANMTFAYANQNMGGVYKKTDNRLHSNGAANTVLEGLPDLSLLKMFIADFNNPARTNTDATNLYMVKDTYESNNNKYLPHIGGEIYIDNNVAIDEYELYDIAQTYSRYLGVDDTPLTICAKTVTACPRAKFIEIKPGIGNANSDGIIANGQQVTIAMYRSNDPDAEVTLPIDLVRNDYDFRGWATYEAVQQYEPNFLKIQGGLAVSNTGGVVPVTSELLDHLAVTIVEDPVTKERTREFAGGASALTFGDSQTTYYAVYTLHKYEVRYVLDIAAYLADNTNEEAYELVLVPSNAYIDAYPPEHIPYYRHDTLAVGKMHKFIGWATDVTQANEQKTRNLHYQIRKNTEFYPAYSVVNNVWTDATVPIPADHLYWTTVRNDSTGMDEVIIYGLKRKYGGRIVIPKMINGMPVTRIIGSNWSASPQGWNTTAQLNNSTWTLTGANGFQDNTEIEHIYFEGHSTNTCNIRSFEQGAFGRMLGLRYIDIPDTVTEIGVNCFSWCSSLGVRDLNQVKKIGSYAFRGVNAMVEDPNDQESPYVEWHEPDLYIGGGDLQIAANVFNNSGWSKLYIGSVANPVTMQMRGRKIHSGNALPTINLNASNNTAYIGTRSLEEIHLYSTVESINDYNGQSLSGNDNVQMYVYNSSVG